MVRTAPKDGVAHKIKGMDSVRQAWAGEQRLPSAGK